MLSVIICIVLGVKFLLYLNQQIYKDCWILYCTSRAKASLPIQTPTITLASYSPLSQLAPSTIVSTKLELWYPKWIKYQYNLHNLITSEI